MISIRNSINDLESREQARRMTLDCYLTALRNLGLYVVELDEGITAPYRRHLEALADSVGDGDSGRLVESRSDLRCLLRNYKDKAARYLAGLRRQLADTASALQALLDSLTQTQDDQGAQLRSSLQGLEELARDPEAGRFGEAVLQAIRIIEADLEEARKKHKVTIAQFRMEIHMLHQRIDVLQAQASIDELTRLFNRREMQERIRNTTARFCLLLIQTTGFRLAEVRYTSEILPELAGAFTRRFRSALPADAVLCRWSEEEFLALVHMEQADALAAAKAVTEHLSGAYACLKDGKTVRPVLQVKVGVVDSAGASPERILERIGEFLTASH